MNIEYFPESSVRLIDGHEWKVVSHFREQIEALAAEQAEDIAVHDLAGFHSIDNCRLFAKRSNADHGICPLQEPHNFECRLLPKTWGHIAWLLEPFSNGSYFAASHQYLDTHGKIQLIISGGRGW
jgi:hypothetical protein